MPLIDSLLKEFGDSGFPKIINPELVGTWDVYQRTALPDGEPLHRVQNVLGFMHLLGQAGMKNKVLMRIKPDDAYKQIFSEKFAHYADMIGRQFTKYRLSDVLRVHKSTFALSHPSRDSTRRVFSFSLCLVPRKSKEHLDGALAKLNGMLYSGDLPLQFRESWKKLPISSNSKPKSALPKFASLVNSESTIGMLPMHQSDDAALAIFGRRAADDVLVLRIVLVVDAPTPIWQSRRKQDDLLKSLFAKTLTKLKG